MFIDSKFSQSQEERQNQVGWEGRHPWHMHFVGNTSFLVLKFGGVSNDVAETKTTRWPWECRRHMWIRSNLFSDLGGLCSFKPMWSIAKWLFQKQKNTGVQDACQKFTSRLIVLWRSQTGELNSNNLSLWGICNQSLKWSTPLPVEHCVEVRKNNFV